MRYRKPLGCGAVLTVLLVMVLFGPCRTARAEGPVEQMPGWGDPAAKASTDSIETRATNAPAAEDQTDAVEGRVVRRGRIGGAESPSGGPSSQTTPQTVGWAGMLGYLLLVLALIVVVIWLMHRLRLGASGTSPAVGRVLLRMPLGPRQSLILVKFLNRLYVLAASPSQISTVECIDSPEAVAKMEGLAAGAAKGSVQGLFDGLLHRHSDAFEGLEDGDDDVMAALPLPQDDDPDDEMHQARGEVKKLLKKIKGLSKIHFRNDSF